MAHGPVVETDSAADRCKDLLVFALEMTAVVLCGLAGVALIVWWGLDRSTRTALDAATTDVLAPEVASVGQGLSPETVSANGGPEQLCLASLGAAGRRRSGTTTGERQSLTLGCDRRALGAASE